MKQVSGQILLYHWNEIIAKGMFHSVQERRGIIKQWNQAFGKNRYNYYEIRHIEIGNVSKSELTLMKMLDIITENEIIEL